MRTAAPLICHNQLCVHCWYVPAAVCTLATMKKSGAQKRKERKIKEKEKEQCKRAMAAFLAKRQEPAQQQAAAAEVSGGDSDSGGDGE